MFHPFPFQVSALTCITFFVKGMYTLWVTKLFVFYDQEPSKEHEVVNTEESQLKVEK